MRFFIATLGILCPFMLGWTDPPDDLHESAPVGGLDVTSIEVAVCAHTLNISIGLNPDTVATEAVQQIWGFLDFDSDQNPETGRVSHIEEFGWEPFPSIGVDFYLLVLPESEDAVTVFRMDDGVDTPVGSYPVHIDGRMIRLSIPRCYDDGPLTSPACLDVPMSVVGVFGSTMDGMTDRFPNDDAARTARFTGDFDGDGDVDSADFDHLRTCRSGPRIPQTLPVCQDADLDDDGDVDHDDFGLFQRSRGAP